MQEVECSGEQLDSDTTVSSITLLDSTGNISASVNVQTGECLSSTSFSQCTLDRFDSRKTRLRMLAMDLKEGVTRDYFCEVTSLRSGQRAKILTWSLKVYGFSKWELSFLSKYARV